MFNYVPFFYPYISPNLQQLYKPIKLSYTDLVACSMKSISKQTGKTESIEHSSDFISVSTAQAAIIATPSEIIWKQILSLMSSVGKKYYLSHHLAY